MLTQLFDATFLYRRTDSSRSSECKPTGWGNHMRQKALRCSTVVTLVDLIGGSALPQAPHSSNQPQMPDEPLMETLFAPGVTAPGLQY